MVKKSSVDIENKTIVDPSIYDRRYFLTDNEGYKEYVLGLEGNVHTKYKRALDIARTKKGDVVLDIGCGRGEVACYCAKMGARVIAVDYSPDAIAIANETVNRFNPQIRDLIELKNLDITEFRSDLRFDTIFMIDIVEHMYDWQLKEVFSALKNTLKDDGKIIISTPNADYEKVLFPVKTLLAMPFTFLKWFFRILRGKYSPKSLKEFLSKAFKVRIGRRLNIDQMHINVMTPSRLKNLLKDFKISLRCLDNSLNPVSLALRRWYGREIFVVAKPKKGEL